MNESLQIVIKRGSQGLYYSIDGKEDIIFDIHFPIVWTIRELTTEDFPLSTYPCDYPKNKKVTGALYCSECRLNGSLNGAIVSYCTECFTNLHSIGEKCGCLCLYNIRTLEDITNKPCEYIDCCLKTYLRGIPLWNIGDREVFEKRGYNFVFIGSDADCITIEDPISEPEESITIYSETEPETGSELDSILDNLSESDLDLNSLPDLVEAEEDQDDEDQIPDLIYEDASIESGFYRQ
jgi:hypothetical protein